MQTLPSLLSLQHDLHSCSAALKVPRRCHSLGCNSRTIRHVGFHTLSQKACPKGVPQRPRACAGQDSQTPTNTAAATSFTFTTWITPYHAAAAAVYLALWVLLDMCGEGLAVWPIRRDAWSKSCSQEKKRKSKREKGRRKGKRRRGKRRTEEQKKRRTEEKRKTRIELRQPFSFFRWQIME